MIRKTAEPVFKPYVMGQVRLLPASYDEMIEPGHLVRVVNDAIDQLDLSPLLAQYKGGGTSSYHPLMMLKVLVYAYTQKIYSSRQIAKALRENIYFMWISGDNQPDFRTINNFRSSRLKDVIDEVFAEVLEYLIEQGKVKLKHYFVDGTTIEANASKHKVVWAKSNAKYQKRVRQQIGELLNQIEAENDAEQAEYGEEDLEERGGPGDEELNSTELKARMEKLNQRLREKGQTKPESKASRKALRKLEKDYLPRLERYEHQAEILGERSSYAKTDPDASCLRVKEDRGKEKSWPKPAYNVQCGTEDQFIVGFSVHPQSSDTVCLIPHLEQVRKNTGGHLPQKIVADAAYGSEENYAYLEEHHAESFLKYTTFYQDTHHYRDPGVLRAHQFRAEHFQYDPKTDTFFCPAGKSLKFQYASKKTTTTGYVVEQRYYECGECADCPLKSQCTKAVGNREIHVSLRLLAYRKKARENLTSEEGKQLRAKRSVEVESVFGHLKQNMGLRRFRLRGLEKVKTEFGLFSIAHNMKKLAAQ